MFLDIITPFLSTISRLKVLNPVELSLRLYISGVLKDIKTIFIENIAISEKNKKNNK